ncbi:MAG TPA: type II and III secretion system protein, partial [Verrucomicrobiae bacterium]
NVGTNGLISSITKEISSSGGTNAAAAVFGNSLSGGLSYFGSIGPTWDVALTAAAADSHASIIQRPRIQTSQAKPAQFFVGDTVPYVTSTYNYGGAYGNQSSYSQLSVGVELDVTPFINPDGLVVMQIQQEIDDLNGYTTITGVGQIPNTIKRTLNTEISVKDKDTVMLGGFIKNKKSTSRSGVPFLQNIPLLGTLFSQRNDSKAREELIVLMRPTVLKTPEIAALNTIKEEQRLPGISAAAADEADAEQKIIETERKKEKKNPKTKSGGFYMQTNAPSEPLPQPHAQGDGSFDVPPPATPLNPNADAPLNPQ